MNKRYIIDSEGNIKVINEKGNEIQKDYKYNKNTEEILSIENFIENLMTKLNTFRNEYNKAKKKKKDSKRTMIAIPILIFVISIILMIGILPLLEYLPLIIISLITGTAILEIPSIIKNVKSSNRIKICDSKIAELTYQINKANKRIDILKKDNTITEKPTGELIEVKNEYDFYFDPEDYFIDKYRIDKRTREMLGEKNKSKKRVRKPSKEDTSVYEF